MLISDLSYEKSVQLRMQLTVSNHAVVVVQQLRQLLVEKHAVVVLEQ